MAKLREIKPVKQSEADVFKRWFTDGIFWDLYVWENEDNDIVGIQLCYDRDRNERALTWFRDRVFMHTKVNFSNPSWGQRMDTPVLVADGAFNNNTIQERFIQDAANLEKRIVDFVSRKIREFHN